MKSKDLCILAHVQRYMYVSSCMGVKGKVVLDVGCGVGYGSEYMARNSAKFVLEIDYSTRAIRYALKNFRRKNLEKKLETLL